jgi:hypothetical protein
VRVALQRTNAFDPLAFDAFPGVSEQSAIRLELLERRVPFLLVALGLGAEPKLGLVELGHLLLDGALHACDFCSR